MIKLKPAKEYWSYRTYMIVITLIYVAQYILFIRSIITEPTADHSTIATGSIPPIFLPILNVFPELSILLSFWFIPLISLYILFALPGIYFLSSIWAFPWEYSVFGKYERTKLPNEKPILKTGKQDGSIGFFFPLRNDNLRNDELVGVGFPFYKWQVFKSGLGISVLGLGETFIPTDKIESIVKIDNWSDPPDGYFMRVTHTSKEINKPIVVPAKVGEELMNIKRKT